MQTRRALLAASAALTATASSAGRAASWPERPIRWIVGFPPGGAPDLLTRILAQRLEVELGQPIVVENRPGAAGNLAAAALARTAPDGSTFGTLFAATLAVNRHVYRNLPFDPRRDFTLISEFARFPSAVMVHPSVPVSSIAELGAWMKAQATPPICATPGAGVIPHLATEMLLRRLGVRCELVHYRGNPDALRDLAAGRAQIMVDAFPTALPLVQDGRARAVAVTGTRRSPLLPEAPTVAETLPGFETASWLAVGAPAGLPEPIAARLGAAVMAAARDPDTARRFASLGAEAIGSTREDLAARVATEDKRWGDLVRAAGITAE
ncbi:Bug family tripartite tricarboxylate transporter substrate binding protein [Paracraurococcus lichenis]|uniref:Tripartite tricarboxylate transporter substrate-binding protein n=1 Tax=Paracraurococcus lichenis TaxID=3064888 RepID=A0ABT9DUN3_9PROT|nr:tripartite tricarboxylate transporter substrate-binding protein [Paracraurococcus sp. LOR1-02]MDO9707609.1 tripartite tricarboxylate transporter substrate-binding protein [Paracraurococcus sp. LOR1-02]